ncbi:MAG TPA: glycosyltransferase family 4 protein, partial [Pyrinomonadaceae bacterium]
TGAPESGLSQAGDYLRHLLWRAPYAVTKFSSRAVARRVESWMDAGRFDVMVCDFLSASLNFPRELRTPAVLFQHNVESALWRRQAEHERSLLKRVAFRLEAAKMARYERSTVNRFHHVIAVSEHDRALMSEMTDAARISVVPTGVDLAQYRAAAATEDERGDERGAASSQVTKTDSSQATKTASPEGTKNRAPLVVFLGSMDWEANIDGVDYFCRDIWPAVLRAVPEARFRIVGRNPHPRVRKLVSDSVEVTGTVPSVIDHLREAAVFVVPLRVGGGTRLKIFEAMATATAVVSTTVGAEGLEVEDGQDILLADDAKTFADSVIMLLRDEKARQRFEKAASALAARHDWSVVIKRFEEALERATAFEPVATGVGAVAASVKA